MDKADHLALDRLVEVIKVGLDKKEIEDLISEIEKEEIEEEEIEDQDEEEEFDEEYDEDEDVYKDLLLHQKVMSWIEDETGETVHGIQVKHVPLSTKSKRYEFDLCPICVRPWSLDDKTHQISALPCGHMFGLSCLKKWVDGSPSSDKCPECNKNFSLESVWHLYAPRFSIPAPAGHRTYVRRFSFSKIGFNLFKPYERGLRTNALNNRSDILKQRADALGRQNDAIERRTKLLNQMADLEKWADVLERHSDAMKRQTRLLNPVTDEEAWAEASEQQADAQKRAEVFRCKACALGQSADECLRKADAFGQHAKALGQQAKSLRELIDSYLACRKFYIQSYKEFLGLRGNKITQ